MSRIKVDRITDKAGTGAPTLVNGMNVTGKSTMGDVVGAAVTFNSVDSNGDINAKGNIVGDNATNISGMNAITAVTGTFGGDVSASGNFTGNVNNTPNLLLQTGGGERVRIGPAGQIGLSGANYGDAGQLLTSGGAGANPTWTTVSAAPSVELVTSDNLVAGDSIAIKSNGQVEKVQATTTLLSPIEASSAAVGAATNGGTDPSCAWDNENNKLVSLYEQSGNYLKVKVGNIVGDSISWTAIDYNIDYTSYQRALAYIGNNRFIIIWTEHSNVQCRAAVITIDYTGAMGVTKGPTVNLHNNETRHVDIESYGTDKAVALYRSHYNSDVYARPLSVSGTTITMGTEVEYSTSSNLGDVQVRRLGTTSPKFLVIWQQNGGTEFSGQMGSYDTSTNTITKLGSAVTIAASTSSTYHSLTYTKDNKFLVQYAGISGYQYTAVLTHDGSNTFTVGTPVITDNHQTSRCCVVYDSGADKGIMIFQDDDVGSGSLWCREITVSGTTPTAGTRVEVQSSNGCNIQPRGAVFIPWAGATWGMTVVQGANHADYQLHIKAANITSNLADFIGYSGASFSATSTATIQIIGNVNTNQSGLTPGLKYYIQRDGTVSTIALNPSVFAGRAISATSLMIGY